MELPKKLNLFEFTGIPDFEHWDKGVMGLKEWKSIKEEVEKKQQRNNLIKIILIIIGVLSFAELIGIIFLIGAYFFRKNSKKNIKLEESLNKAYRNYESILWEHTDSFITPLANKIMTNEQWRSFRTKKIGFIYSNNRFIYFDSGNGLLVAYNKSNIKEVSRERLHVGANTTGSSGTAGVGYTFQDSGITVGSAETHSQSNTTNYYEWHFDILTDYITYPKVSLILEDSRQVEDFIGQAYAILKP
ncbi:hypothetical protein IGI39_003005 [Enterococcus sp. AZ135]|uniref:hypothetical protein n=1 Tax=unclassified Enterococcus TaxID=2608891 RepID=UPI003F269ACD